MAVSQSGSSDEAFFELGAGNPYANTCDLLQREIAAAKAAQAERARDIAWYDAFDPDAASTSIRGVEKQLDELVEAMHSAYEKITAIETEIQKERAGSGWNPVAIVISNLGPLLAFRRDRDLFQSKLSGLRSEHARLVERLAEAFDERDRHRNFDVLGARAELQALELQMKGLTQDLARATRIREDYDRATKEQLEARSRDARREMEIIEDLNFARSLEGRLSDPNSTGRDRALVHDECRTQFGDSSPSSVLRAKERELGAVRRNLRKHDERLGEIARRFRLRDEIKGLVIDGNNLCYRNGAEFIGLQALEALVGALHAHGSYRVLPVQVVFDAGIERQTKAAVRDIEARLGVPVHVVPGRQRADETVLTLASAKGAHVVSNDNFADFAHSPVVKGGRILRHNIVGEVIMVHELDLSATFHAPSSQPA